MSDKKYCYECYGTGYTPDLEMGWVGCACERCDDIDVPPTLAAWLYFAVKTACAEAIIDIVKMWKGQE